MQVGKGLGHNWRVVSNFVFTKILTNVINISIGQQGIQLFILFET